jgi:peroxiredoxin/predicted 2-oxoglutarate/Fe(II)-dependent dioxygenase YbiX
MTCARPSVGDIAPDPLLISLDGKEISLRSDSIAGNPIVLVFCPKWNFAGKRLLECTERRIEQLRMNGAKVFGVVLEGTNHISYSDFHFQICSDHRDQIFTSFNVNRNHTSTLLLRRNHHIAGIFDGDPERQISDVVSSLERMSSERLTSSMHMHPPVLLIPDVFSRDDCARLIETFNSKGQKFIESQAAVDHLGGIDYKMRVPEHMREDRIDHFFFEQETVGFLCNRLSRVIPEIHKSFHYRITKYESLRMACYQGHRGGLSYGHRDNIPPHFHRRFAMSINLNTEDFEGGELRFPEFGDQRYRPETGTAIIFSSSLLHEAMHVTAGRRFVFLAFLFGET